MNHFLYRKNQLPNRMIERETELKIVDKVENVSVIAKASESTKSETSKRLMIILMCEKWTAASMIDLAFHVF